MTDADSFCRLSPAERGSKLKPRKLGVPGSEDDILKQEHRIREEALRLKE